MAGDRLVDGRGIVTISSEMGRDELWGVPVNQVRGALGRTLYASAKALIENYEKKGMTFLDKYNVHVYGPFPSAQLLEPMLDPEYMEIDEQHAHQIVKETAESTEAWNHYLLVAGFSRVRERTTNGTQIQRAQ